jgi:hypothetical protein
VFIEKNESFFIRQITNYFQIEQVEIITSFCARYLKSNHAIEELDDGGSSILKHPPIQCCEHSYCRDTQTSHLKYEVSFSLEDLQKIPFHYDHVCVRNIRKNFEFFQIGLVQNEDESSFFGVPHIRSTYDYF